MARAFKKHRENKHRQESGEPRRIRNRRTWYNEEKYDGVMFVDTTENGELKKRVETACRKNRLKIKVVEKISSTVKKELQRSNPFGQKHCQRNDCVTCELELPINCRKRGQVYEMYCEDCKSAMEIEEKK